MTSATAPRAAASVVICGLALLSFFQFPGHTWLQQDTQIYQPILEHLRDPGVLQADLVVQYPHVSYTLYDEFTLGIQRLTEVSFEHVLEAQQIVSRAFGIWGIYLIATAAGLDLWAALLAASIFSLGALIAGPSVLTFEYEPTPRAFAIPLVFCAIGLVSNRRYAAGGIVCAIAFLIHPPSTIPFWIAMLFVSWKAKPVWIALACAAVVIAIAGHLQPGMREQQEFFGRLTAGEEQVQRIRTSYNWISTWWRTVLPQYFVLYSLAMFAYSRIRHDLGRELRRFSLVLPAMGILSVPVSYLLLEQMKWSLVPQIQPMRVLLFVTAFALILGTFAAIKARAAWESVAWFLLVFYIPMRNQLFDPTSLRIVLTALGLAAAAAFTLRLRRPAPIAAGLAAFFVIPVIAGISNYPNLHTPAIADLSHWARVNTRPGAMFLFPDAGHGVYPGIFRAEAMRPLYVDWKSGGQVNYLKDFAAEWTRRWNLVNREGYGASAVPCYRNLGIDYLVLQKNHLLSGFEPLYRNSQYAVYRITH